jgi:iron complex transport system substrate-binding protein
MRVVSLIASATEILHALGCGHLQVGRSHECDFPPDVKKLPQLTEPKFGADGSSAQIDERVKEILRSALSVYRVQPEPLDALAPDVILTQSHCEVCAVSLKDVEAAVCQLISSKPRIVSLSPNGLADVFASIHQVASALGVPARGVALAGELHARMNAIAARARNLRRVSIAMIEWMEPLMAAGNWMPTLCEMAGGETRFGEADKHSPWMTWDDLVAADPEVIVVLPCGFDIARTMQERALFTERPEWANLRAVKSGRVFAADGNQYFNRPGPRLVESLEILAEILHPEAFRFGHEGVAYRAF